MRWLSLPLPPRERRNAHLVWRATRACARLREGVGRAVGNQYGGVRRRRGRCGKGKRDSQRKIFLGPKRQYRKHTRTRATSTQRAKSGWRSARTAARARAPPRPTNHLRRDSACGHRPIRPQRDAGSDALLTRARRAALFTGWSPGDRENTVK